MWKSSLHQVNQCEPFVVVKLEIGMEWSCSRLMAMAGKMDPVILLETTE